MSISEILSNANNDVSTVFLRMAQYATNQCTGCSDSPQILAFKAQQAMLEAHDRQENPIQCLNEFLGTSIAEEVLLSLI